jgi:hypothetical protein
MAQGWFCSDCRSLNDAGAKRCYSCSLPRKTAESLDGTFRSTSAVRETTVEAQAQRLGTRYRPSWPVAVVVVPLIVAATIFDIERTQAFSRLVDPAGRFVNAAPAYMDTLLELSVTSTVAYVLAIVAWSLWIALVVSNVPALVARWPSYTAMQAFFAPFIPFVNLKRPGAVVSEAVGLLSRERTSVGAVVGLWWITWLAAYFVPGILTGLRRYLGSSETTAEIFVIAQQVRLFILVPAGILAILVVILVERVQREALKRRASTVLAPDRSAMPAR